MSDRKLRDDSCFWAKSLFNRTLAGGASVNISVQVGQVVHKIEVGRD